MISALMALVIACMALEFLALVSGDSYSYLDSEDSHGSGKRPQDPPGNL